MTTKLTLYKLDRFARGRRRQLLRTMLEDVDVTLLPPRARAVLVSRIDDSATRLTLTTRLTTIKFPWLAVAPVAPVDRGSMVSLRQLVVGFNADPRGGYLTPALLPTIHVIGLYFTCLGSYPRREDTSHVNFFTTAFSSLTRSDFFAMHDPDTVATVRECGP